MPTSLENGYIVCPKPHAQWSGADAVTYGWDAEEPFPPAAGITMPASDVRKLVLSALGGQFSPASPAVVQFFDGMYYLPTLAEVRWIFARSVVAKMEWTVERFDCDDFAFGLKGEFSLYAYRNNDLDFGLSLGVVAGAFTWQPAHVACFFVDATETVYLLEPRAADPVNPHGVIAFLDPSACQSCNLILL